jgi:hypothetical protein
MRLRRDEVLTADRGFYSFDNWMLAAGTGADLIWRAPTGLNLPVVKVLPDGTFLTVLINRGIRGARRRGELLAAAKAGAELDPHEACLARVVEYDVPDRDGNGSGELVVVLSTILDPADARADEIAAGYGERWEEETANDQLKTHLRGPGRVLRSRPPDLVVQEMWAWLIVQHALTALIADAAEAADLDPDRVSFARALRLVRRSATGTADIPWSAMDASQAHRHDLPHRARVGGELDSIGGRSDITHSNQNGRSSRDHLSVRTE